MSLISSASPWTSDDNSKKRQSTMRKTIKSKPAADIPAANVSGDLNEYASTEKDYRNMQPATIEETQIGLQDRNNRVNDLLNKITAADNAGDAKMGNFTPLPNPDINVKKDMDDNTGDLKYVLPKMSYPGSVNPQKIGNYVANDAGSNPSAVYSNYRMSYEKPILFNKPVNTTQAPSGITDNKLLEKINYMIHLLEEERLEKTNNITEEFILYTFLGVFIIFIVDGFSRSGKYVR